MLRKISILLFIGLFVFAGIRCSSKEARKDKTGSIDSLQVEDVRYLQNSKGERYLTGAILNPTKSTMSKVQVLVTLYNDKQQRIDEMNFLVDSLPADQRTRFREPVSSTADVRGARVRSLMKM